MAKKKAALPDGAFEFDAASRRYRDKRSGLYVARSDVDKAVGRMVDAGTIDINGLARRLQSGAIDIPTWQKAMAASIKRSHTAGVIAAAGGRQNVSKADWGDMGARLRGQYKYLRNFAKQIEDGTAPLDGRFLARCEMYGRSSSLSYNAVQRRHDGAAGFTEERRVLNSLHPCEDCPRYQAMGWRPIGTIPLPTEGCQCLTNCKCSMERRRPDAVPPQAENVPRFGPSDARVEYAGTMDEAKVLTDAERILGKKPNIKELTSLTGATKGSTVRIESTGNSIIFNSEKKGVFESKRTLIRSLDGSKVYLMNDSLVVAKDQRGKGIGREIFGRQVEYASQLGVNQIRCLAVKGRGYNGYSTWPRFGYDSELPGAVLKKVQNMKGPLRDAKRVSDLMRSKEGRDLWDQNGETAAMDFDLEPGSLSRRVWEAYLASKEK